MIHRWISTVKESITKYVDEASINLLGMLNKTSNSIVNEEGLQS